MIYLSQKWKNEQNPLFHANVERPKGSTMTSSTLKNTKKNTSTDSQAYLFKVRSDCLRRHGDWITVELRARPLAGT